MTKFELYESEATGYIERHTREKVLGFELNKEARDQICCFCGVFYTETKKIRVTETFGYGYCRKKYLTYFDVTDPKKSVRIKKSGGIK